MPKARRGRKSHAPEPCLAESTACRICPLPANINLRDPRWPRFYRSNRHGFLFIPKTPSASIKTGSTKPAYQPSRKTIAAALKASAITRLILASGDSISSGPANKHSLFTRSVKRECAGGSRQATNGAARRQKINCVAGVNEKLTPCRQVLELARRAGCPAWGKGPLPGPAPWHSVGRSFRLVGRPEYKDRGIKEYGSGGTRRDAQASSAQCHWVLGSAGNSRAGSR